MSDVKKWGDAMLKAFILTRVSDTVNIHKNNRLQQGKNKHDNLWLGSLSCFSWLEKYKQQPKCIQSEP